MTTSYDALLDEYAQKTEPLVPLAKRAYGAKDQDTPAHSASREYTRLLVEYHSRGGSLIALAKRIGVSYSGVRRRVFTADIPTVRRARTPRGEKVTSGMIDAAVLRVTAAKAASTYDYHRQLHEEFTAGIPMNLLARRLGISNAAPLYYGVQSHVKKMNEAAV